MKETGHFGEIGVGGKIILKCILNKYFGRWMCALAQGQAVVKMVMNF